MLWKAVERWIRDCKRKGFLALTINLGLLSKEVVKMKRYECIVLAVVFGLALSAGTAGAAVYYQSGFEDPPFNAVADLNGQDGWGSRPGRVNVVDNAYIYAGDAHSGTQHVYTHVLDNYSSAYITKTFGSGSNNVGAQYAEWYVRPTKVGADNTLYFRIYDISGRDAVYVYFKPDKTITMTNVTGSIGTWANDTWYGVNVELDYTTKKVDVYIDTNLAAANVSFYNSGSSSMDTFRADTFNNKLETEYGLDDVSFSSIPEPATMALLMLGLPLALRRRRPRVG